MSEPTILSEEKPKTKPKLFDGFFKRLKKIKHLDIILTILFIAIILLIYFSSTVFSTTNEEENINTQTLTTSLGAYAVELENKLENVIGSISGAGNVSVMVYFNKGIETIIAYNTEKQTSSDGTITETKSPVLITTNGETEVIVLQEILPLPSSILIVATGASNTNVKLEILRAVQTMFNLSTSNIEIFAGN